MIRKTILLIFAVIVSVCSLYATESRIYFWESENSSLLLEDSFGTTMGETVRAEDLRSKAYHLFNIIASSSEKIRTEIRLNQETPGPVIGEARYGTLVTNSLDIEDTMRKIGIDTAAQETYNPCYDDGKLFYMKWAAGNLDLEADNISIFRSKEGFEFFGKRKDNILIRISGKLKFLSEVDWLDVESLKGFTVSDNWKWLNSGKILAYIERDTDGKRYIAVASIRTGERQLFAQPVKGEVKDMAASNDGEAVYCAVRSGDMWQLCLYDRADKSWKVKAESPGRLVLLGVRKGSLLWLDTRQGSINSSDGSVIKELKIKAIDTYPQGKYIYGATEETLDPAGTHEVFIVFHSGRNNELGRMGIEETDKFSGNPETWILPARYEVSIERVPPDPGHLFLSLENSRIYFDHKINGLRRNGSVKLIPAFPKTTVLAVLAALLIILLLNRVFRKTREVTS